MLASWPYFQNGINIELSNTYKWVFSAYYYVKPSVFLTEKVKSGKWYLLFLEQPTILPHINCHKVGWIEHGVWGNFPWKCDKSKHYFCVSVKKFCYFRLYYIEPKSLLFLPYVTTRRQNVKSRPIWQKVLSKKVLRLSI